MNTIAGHIRDIERQNGRHDWSNLVRKLEFLQIELAHHYTCRGSLFSRIHSHRDTAHFCYIISGSCVVSIGGKHSNVSPGQALYVPPGILHGSLNDKETDFELIEIKFSFGSYSQQVNVSEKPFIQRVSNKTGLLISLERFLEAYLLAGNENWLTKIRLAEALITFFENDVLIAQPRFAGDIDLKIRQVVQHMHLHYAEPLTVETMAELANISHSYFANKFKEVMNVSPIEFLIRIRLQHVKELLQNSNLTIKQISAICGLSSPKYLARLFAARFGVVPGQFRKHLKT